MRGHRLDTEQLIQDTRTHYQDSQHTLQLQELQLALQLRTKEVLRLTEQLGNSRHAHALRQQAQAAEVAELQQ
jgi:hypothetical protein